ncbi:MAG: UDP-3-O-(3-hydroxymyristoyl)glucosamine N-acyltransferase [Saprospirales bacterium]|nr:MAG: UDP-3-O-(3-hydroxymyristoyl)glucosamine N-acyltransferase [Saprospirales bacterium]
MDITNPIPVVDLARKYNCVLKGRQDLTVRGINEIHKVREGDLTFVDVEKYYRKSLNSAATVILINKEVEVPEGKAILVCENPFEVYNQLVASHRPFEPFTESIDSKADIQPDVILEPNVVIGPYSSIGSGTYIRANTVIGSHCHIGKNVIIGPNSTIGGDAFYYKKTREGFQKWVSGGRVIIEDEVEIGANCTIDKGVSGDTVIGRGSKLDNLIHIGHGAVLGKNCLLAGQVGVSGKTILGDNVVLYGQVGIAQNLTIGDNVVVMAKSGVSKSIPADKVYFGIPAADVKEKYKEIAGIKLMLRDKGII